MPIQDCLAVQVLNTRRRTQVFHGNRRQDDILPLLEIHHSLGWNPVLVSLMTESLPEHRFQDIP